MTKYIDSERPVGISLKLPVELISQLERIQKEERVDRTNLIIKCIEGYMSAGGKTKSEIEILKRMDIFEEKLGKIADTISTYEQTVKTQQQIIEKQSSTIDILLSKIAK